ncbi:MAG: hypothetical protein QOH18_393 [Solirubrobacterales bacterium]|jgi:hypothetical protein|nr:hypothetical protein [Solirubrobacterales bacterium]
MELVRVMKALRRQRRLVAIGAVLATIAAILSIYQVSLYPPGLTGRTNEFATASTEIVVDTPSSAFANLTQEISPLATRATVFSRFLASPLAIELIAREAKLPANAIEGQGPYEQNLPLFQQEPTAEKRSSQIVGQRALYRLRFENNPTLPVIAVYAQAPTSEEAHRLADAVPAALGAYIENIQQEQKTPAKHRVVVRQLGHATGADVNAGVNVQIALLVFFVVMILWCLLLIPAHTIARGWRAQPERERRHRGGDNGKGPGGQRSAARPYFERHTH